MQTEMKEKIVKFELQEKVYIGINQWEKITNISAGITWKSILLVAKIQKIVYVYLNCKEIYIKLNFRKCACENNFTNWTVDRVKILFSGGKYM